jgi:hypothetical protein
MAPAAVEPPCLARIMFMFCCYFQVNFHAMFYFDSGRRHGGPLPDHRRKEARRIVVCGRTTKRVNQSLRSPSFHRTACPFCSLMADSFSLDSIKIDIDINNKDIFSESTGPFPAAKASIIPRASFSTLISTSHSSSTSAWDGLWEIFPALSALSIKSRQHFWKFSLTFFPSPSENFAAPVKRSNAALIFLVCSTIFLRSNSKSFAASEDFAPPPGNGPSFIIQFR